MTPILTKKPMTMSIQWRVIAIPLIISFILSCGQLSAQKEMGTMPTYLKADNADPIIQIYSGADMETASISSLFIPDMNRTVSLDDYSTLDEGIFALLVHRLEGRLNEMGIEPRGYVSVGSQNFTDAGAMDELLELMTHQKPYYVLTITILKWKKLTKEVTKADGRLTLDMIRKPAIAMGKLGSKDLKESYAIFRGGDLENCLAYFEGQLLSKPEGYFDSVVSSTVDYEALAREGKTWTDLWVREDAEHHSWPAPTELESGKILILGIDSIEQSSFTRSASIAIAQNFPYEYEMMSLSEEIDSADLADYSYVLLPNSVEVRDMNSDRIGGSDWITQFYYVLKDLRTFDIYSGPKPAKLIGHTERRKGDALTRFVKVYGKSLE